MTKHMKYIFAILFAAVATLNLSAQEQLAAEPTTIKWYTWEEAHELNKTEPKKVFIDLYTDWCGWCKKMDKTTFTDPEVVKYLNAHFYPVKFNAEQKETIVFNDKEFKWMKGGRRGVHELAYALLNGRLGYPAFVMLDESFARILISPGYKVVDQLIQELTFAKEEVYKEMSWQDYMKGGATSGQQP